jgi:hypothetical protein
MKAVYRLVVDEPSDFLTVEEGAQLGTAVIGKVTIKVEIDDDTRRVTGVVLTVHGVQVQSASDGALLMRNPEAEKEAFAAASHVANIFRLVAGVDGINPRRVVGNSPELHGETPEEIERLAKSTKRGTRSVPATIAICRPLGQATWDAWLQASTSDAVQQAAATFAEGLRLQSPFARLEYFYKVQEHLFPHSNPKKTLDGMRLDQAVSGHVAPLAPEFDVQRLTELRELRIRSAHAYPRSVADSHLSPQRLADLEAVMQALPDMERLARLLLDNPPQPPTQPTVASSQP